ncbi:MAG: dihydrodipicolinate synthase family protein [Candidatus Dormibacteraeota bacterium]|nr:dihydrodipicolinate synthase family protein [Candidatus Dormibacteraeota bacterium]
MDRPRRVLAAAVTPLTDGGAHVDVAAIDPLATFYAASGLDGLLVLGTTGEGVLLPLEDRRAAAAAFVASARGLDVVVHCGAQSTADTVALAEHAAMLGAAGVAVIAPPYFALDERSLEAHFAAAAAACAPTPFFLYEFAARSGYAIPVPLVERLRSRVSNLAGMKVSDVPFEAVLPYLELGLDVYVGAEELISRALDHGAAGAVSGLAAALPEVTIDAVRSGSPAASRRAASIRAILQRFPFHAALKHVLRHRAVPISAAVRAPLRGLDREEEVELAALLADSGELSQRIAVSTSDGAVVKRVSDSDEMSNVVQR